MKLTLSVPEAAEVWGISRQYLWKLIREQGDLPVQPILLGGKTVFPRAAVMRSVGMELQDA